MMNHNNNMGQARKRGSFEERKAQALVRLDERRMSLIEDIRAMKKRVEETPVKESAK